MSTSAAKLQLIANSLGEIELSATSCDGADGLTARLSGRLRAWDGRCRYFDAIRADLGDIAKKDSGLLAPTRELREKAENAEYVLNLIMRDQTIPPSETAGSIRFVVEREQLRSSPLVLEALVRQALYGTSPMDARRLAWLSVYEHVAHEPHAVAAIPVQVYQPPSSTGDTRLNNPAEEFGGETLRTIREESIDERSTLGPRGTVLDAADVDGKRGEYVPRLLVALVREPGIDRNEVALTLGEIGGQEAAAFLAAALHSELMSDEADEDYQVNLVSALANIGGPDAVEGLLRAAEGGSERVRLVALSGLEALATTGAVAVIEYPEPAAIESDEMHEAYVGLAEQLRALVYSQGTPPYVRHKAAELLETVMLSLDSAHIPT
jgi:hypothetical protein